MRQSRRISRRVFGGMTALVGTMIGTVMLTDASYAQSMFARDRNVSVLQRERPEYDPLGIRSGSFIIRPRLETVIAYTDNVFAFDRNIQPVFGELDDTFFILRPSADIESNWNRHALNAGAYAEAVQHLDFDDEDIANYGASLDGRLDVNRFTSLIGGVGYDNRYETRKIATTNLISREPIEYQRATAFLGAQQEFGRFRYQLRGDIADLEFQDGLATDNITVITQGFRDVLETRLTGQIGYALTPDTSVFIRAGLNERDHDIALVNQGGNRDSEGFDISTGIDFDLTRLARGSVALGYLEQDFENFGTAKGVSVDAGMEWFPTELTTVTFRASRGVRDSALFINNTAAYIESDFGVRVDHELLRNVILSASAGYGQDDYEDFDRTDDRFGIAIGGQYLINRIFRAKLDYVYEKQESDTGAGDPTIKEFDSNEIFLTLVAER